MEPPMSTNFDNLNTGVLARIHYHHINQPGSPLQVEGIVKSNNMDTIGPAESADSHRGVDIQLAVGTGVGDLATRVFIPAGQLIGYDVL